MSTPDHNGRAPEGAAPPAGRGAEGPADDTLERPTVSRTAGVLGPAATLAGDGQGASTARAGAPLALTALPPLQAIKRRDPPGVSDLEGDPEGIWRRKGRFSVAAIRGGILAPNGPEVLRRHDAAALLDVWFALMEWGQMAADPEVRAFAQRCIEAGEAIRRRDKDADGRAIPLGRLLGLQPASGATAGTAIDLARRNTLLRRARASAPAWRDAPTKDAARAIAAAFDRYAAGGWLADRSRETAPAAEPTASWWRILKLDLSHPMPREKRLAQILAEAK